MKTLSLFSAAVVLSVSAISAHAQGTSFGAGGTSTTAGATTIGGERPKVLIATERQFITNMCSSIQMQFALAEKGAGKGRSSNPEMLTLCEGLSTELHAVWDKLVALATARGVEPKYIPQVVSKRDQSQIEKLDKQPEEKWPVEFYELMLKEVRSTSNTALTNTKMTKDEELKKIAEEMVAMYKYQSEQLEAARKTAKAVKPVKKDKEKKW